MVTARAQGVFEPATVDLSPKYHEYLLRTLIGDSRYYYLCTPAFGGEYALSLHDDTLVYAQMAKYDTTWERYELMLNHDEERVIYSLLDDATMTANFYEGRIGIDGVTYFLCCWGRKVKVWYPEKGSRTHRTVIAMDSLCHAVQHADHKLLARQLDTCRNLTAEFRRLYALEYFAPSKGISRYSFYGVYKLRSISLHSHSHLLSIKLRVNEGNDSIDEAYMDSLCDSVAVWSRELFLHHDGYKVDVLLCDTLDARCEVIDNRNRYVVIPRSALSRSLILGITALDKGHYRLTPDGQWQAVRSKDFRWWPSSFDMW